MTAFFAPAMAIVQTDIKRVLAYSTCSASSATCWPRWARGACSGGYFHLATHAFFKALLFLSAGSVIHAVHTNEMSEMGGLWRPMRFTAFVFGVGAARAWPGFPLISGLCLQGPRARGLARGCVQWAPLANGATRPEPVLWFPFLACLCTVLLTAYYMTNVFLKVFFGRRRGARTAPTRGTGPCACPCCCS